MIRTALAFLMIGMIAKAETKEVQPSNPSPVPAGAVVITNKDAKKACKAEGKTGDELIQCMKDKKDGKKAD